MATIGASLSQIEPGRVDISAPFADHITQQHGFRSEGLPCDFYLLYLLIGESSLVFVLGHEYRPLDFVTRSLITHALKQSML